MFKKQPPELFCKKNGLKNLVNFTVKHLFRSLLFIKVAEIQLAWTYVFSCKICKTFKNTFFIEHVRETASADYSTIAYFVNKSSYSFRKAATRGVLCKKVFLEISLNSQKNTCARVLF